MLSLNPFRVGILWEIDIKNHNNNNNNKKPNFKRLYLKKGQIQSQNWSFLKVHLIFFKPALFFACSTRQGIPPPTPVVAARGLQRLKS